MSSCGCAPAVSSAPAKEMNNRISFYRRGQMSVEKTKAACSEFPNQNANTEPAQMSKCKKFFGACAMKYVACSKLTALAAQMLSNLSDTIAQINFARSSGEVFVRGSTAEDQDR
jgi:hypothetical protein